MDLRTEQAQLHAPAHHPHATNNFHLIRILAAILVIITHSYPITGRIDQDLMWQLTNGHFTFSYFGLSTFFIISGYLITKSAKPEQAMNFKTASRFLWRRFLRIFPALIVMILLTIFVLGPLLTDNSLGSYFHNPETWTYLSNISLYSQQGHLPGVFLDYGVPGIINGSLWTLCYEFTLYLAVMLLAISSLLRRRYFMLIFYAIALCGLSSLTLQDLSENLTVFGLQLLSLSRFVLFFLGGMILYLFKEKIPLKFSLFLPASTLMIFSYFTAYSAFGNYLFLPYIIIYLANIPCRLNKFGLHGDYSYGMYIYAFPVQKIIAWFFPGLDLWIMIPYSILATFPLAYLSWNLIESKMLALKKQSTLPVAYTAYEEPSEQTLEPTFTVSPITQTNA